MPRDPSHDDDFSCPLCGATVRAGAASCRQCGASEESGWGEDEWNEGGGYAGDDDFDYDDYVRREFPDDAPPEHPSIRTGVTAIIVLLLCLGMLLASFYAF